MRPLLARRPQSSPPVAVPVWRRLTRGSRIMALVLAISIAPQSVAPASAVVPAQPVGIGVEPEAPGIDMGAGGPGGAPIDTLGEAERVLGALAVDASDAMIGATWLPQGPEVITGGQVEG